MKRFGMTIRLKPGSEEAYKRITALCGWAAMHQSLYFKSHSLEADPSAEMTDVGMPQSWTSADGL